MPDDTNHACPVCGSIYESQEEAARCAAVPAPPEEIPPGTLVEARDAAPETGAGYLTRSFLVGLDDPRAPVHTRFYRVSFLWGRADFRAEEIVSHGPTTEDEWRQAVFEGRIGRRD